MSCSTKSIAQALNTTNSTLAALLTDQSSLASLSASTSTGLSTVNSAVASLSTLASTGLSSVSSAAASLSTALSSSSESLISLSTSTSTGLSNTNSAIASLSTGAIITNTGLSTVNSAVASLSTIVDTKADLIAGTVPASQLPSYVDDVLEFPNLASFPVVGEAGKIYTDTSTNLVYRWSGTTYVPLGGDYAVTTKDEGTILTTATTEYNFTGGGVTAANSGGMVTVTVHSASETQVGAVELATPAETAAGASTTLAVTPAGLSAALSKFDGVGDQYSNSGTLTMGDYPMSSYYSRTISTLVVPRDGTIIVNSLWQLGPSILPRLDSDTTDFMYHDVTVEGRNPRNTSTTFAPCSVAGYRGGVTTTTGTVTAGEIIYVGLTTAYAGGIYWETTITYITGVGE